MEREQQQLLPPIFMPVHTRRGSYRDLSRHSFQECEKSFLINEMMRKSDLLGLDPTFSAYRSISERYQLKESTLRQWVSRHAIPTKATSLKAGKPDKHDSIAKEEVRDKCVEMQSQRKCAFAYELVGMLRNAAENQLKRPIRHRFGCHYC
jgi:hypothetical protein